MSEPLPYRILCPEGIVAEGEARMLVIPGTEGDLGVLKRHSPVIVQLRPGTVALFADSNTKASTRYFIDGGIAHVTPESLTVLSDDIHDLAQASEGDLSNSDPDVLEAFRTAIKSPAYA